MKRKSDGPSGASSGSLLSFLDPQSRVSGVHRLTDGREHKELLKFAEKTTNQPRSRVGVRTIISIAIVSKDDRASH
jgi:hypothetical protein